jgi:hypothetical protein
MSSASPKRHGTTVLVATLATSIGVTLVLVLLVGLL